MNTNNEPVIGSLLDNDLYKFTMMQAVLHNNPGVSAEYAFKCRNKSTQIPMSQLLDAVNENLDHLCSLEFEQEELDYLRGLRYIKPDFVDFLEGFQLRRRFIEVKADGDNLDIRVKGPMLQCMQFEIFTLSIVNELYFRRVTPDLEAAYAEGRARLQAKIDMLHEFAKQPPKATPYLLSDFGTRRRYSRAWHEYVVKTMAEAVPQYFRGTSNVDFARRLGLTPIGTMAHEYLQAFQAFDTTRLRNFQNLALETWVKEYRGDLGVALTDVVGTDAFLRDLDSYFLKLFDGFRHDSGSPFEWSEKVIARCKELRVDPLTKQLYFSDGLDIPRTIELYNTFGDRAKTAFGVGTNLTNDLGIEALNIVIKLIRCNGQPVAKLSDTPGKTMCEDEHFLTYLKDVFQIKY
jgi:nicotinate phosphoribosyltransferase